MDKRMPRQQEPTVYDLAYRGKTAAVKILLNENQKLKSETDENKRMLIHWAALGGHEDLVTYLLSNGFPVDPQDDMSMTPLILASSGGRKNVVKILLKEGANVNAKTEDGHSSIQYAASKNWVEICETLIKNGANINITDIRGATPLHRAASKGNINVVKLLLEQEKDLKINAKDVYGNTALHLACEENRQDEAKLLVTNGADILSENKEKKTPLDLASLGLVRQLKEIQKKTESTE
ncbi:26S proteasome non-ATPase regulatory subunit 10-like [Leptopilina boulardi]|uniref:26S proteasome non-ATPase regulatory subunit 10-like n=1 Tax=Leptopilina boulardi TaxID=63433 RepID=UPI0021F55502|nr:26S proteasome non-ATPase regulatory subunit 10-like [Leptopilina boulardi]